MIQANEAPPRGNVAAGEIVEVVFKGRRREYFSNPRELAVHVGDQVIVQADRGIDLGRVHHTSEWVKREDVPVVIREILRSAQPEDIEALERNRAKEERAFETAFERIQKRDIEMKLVDVEYQFDGNRITFFFTAEKRVDFRDLVKDLASAFRTRIELRQIGVRDEAGRIGGVGTCGRELCCATWLREFDPITLKMAKDQGLSPSPSKISGACGRLKCCLRYELDFYKESAREFPRIGSKLTLKDEEREVTRVDIFRRTIVLTDEAGSDLLIGLADLPPGTKISGPSRDRRKGCDKTKCGSRGSRPGDGESDKGGGNPPRENPPRENPQGGNPRSGEPRRGGESRGGESRGGESRGGESRGGESRGGESRGGESRGGESRGGESRGGESRGGGRPHGRSRRPHGGR